MIVSKIIAKAQTTLPSGVRKALGVEPGDAVSRAAELLEELGQAEGPR